MSESSKMVNAFRFGMGLEPLPDELIDRVLGITMSSDVKCGMDVVTAARKIVDFIESKKLYILAELETGGSELVALSDTLRETLTIRSRAEVLQNGKHDSNPGAGDDASNR